MEIILASSSPRRLELLRLIGLEPRVIIPMIDEEIKPGESVDDFVHRLTKQKGEAIYRDEFFEIPVISSDTVVYINRTILGKPEDRQDAFDMLKNLSGNVHEVMTGVGILYRGECIVDHVVTRVYFKRLSGEEIDYYLDSEEYGDKAGAYGIQGKASIFVEKIEGCYFNVMGFPLNLFYTMLKKIGIEIYR